MYEKIHREVHKDEDPGSVVIKCLFVCRRCGEGGDGFSPRVRTLTLFSGCETCLWGWLSYVDIYIRKTRILLFYRIKVPGVGSGIKVHKHRLLLWRNL